MRSYAPGYEIEAPGSLSAVLVRFASQPGVWKPFAGGTDLMVLLEAGKLPQRKFLSIWDLAELRGIELTHSHAILGALTTYIEIRNNQKLARMFPMLARAAAETGSIATQNRGTIGGNIANASPAADSPPALLVYNAELELASARGSRWVPYHGFWSGYKKLALGAEELIARIRMPLPSPEWKHYYRKVGNRRAQAISKVCFAGMGKMDSNRVREIRIALGSVAPTVFRAVETEKILQGENLSPALFRAAQETFAREIAPIDDIRSTARYRRAIAGNLLAEFVETLSA